MLEIPPSFLRRFGYQKFLTVYARRAAESRRLASAKERDRRLLPISARSPRRGPGASRPITPERRCRCTKSRQWALRHEPTGPDMTSPFSKTSAAGAVVDAAESSHLFFFFFFPLPFHVLATVARNCYVSAVSVAPATGCRMPLAARCLIVLQKSASLVLLLAPPPPGAFHFVPARGWVSWRAGVLRSVTGFQAASLASAGAAAVECRRPTTLLAREPVGPAIGRGVHLFDIELVMVT